MHSRQAAPSAVGAPQQEHGGQDLTHWRPSAWRKMMDAGGTPIAVL
jgi:hypothetical protein